MMNMNGAVLLVTAGRTSAMFQNFSSTSTRSTLSSSASRPSASIFFLSFR